MKALKEIGLKRGFKFLFSLIVKFFLELTIFPPCRILLLKFLGAQIGKDTLIYKVSLFNLYRTGLRGLKIGPSCFLADEVMLDLADEIVLENQVTLAVRAMILTHTNVGYKDHPLQKYFPSFTKPVRLERGCFIGAGAIILPGVTVGEKSFVAAGSVVTKDVPPSTLVAGVPAKKIRKIQ